VTETPLFTTFLERMQPDRAERRRLQTLSGAAIRADWTTTIVHVGVGPTGKTTFQQIMQAAHPDSGHIHETANVISPQRSLRDRPEIYVHWDVVIPIEEMDIWLARKIIATELEGVRAWLRAGIGG